MESALCFRGKERYPYTTLWAKKLSQFCVCNNKSQENTLANGFLHTHICGKKLYAIHNTLERSRSFLQVSFVVCGKDFYELHNTVCVWYFFFCQFLLFLVLFVMHAGLFCISCRSHLSFAGKHSIHNTLKRCHNFVYVVTRAPPIVGTRQIF